MWLYSFLDIVENTVFQSPLTCPEIQTGISAQMESSQGDTGVNKLLFNMSYTIPYIFFRVALFFWVELVTQAGSLWKYLLVVDLEGAGCCPATS